MSNTVDYMEEFNKLYKKVNENEGSGGFHSYEIKDIQKEHNIVRLVGVVGHIRRAWIFDDNEKKIPIDYNEGSIFDQIVKKVLSFKWVPAPQGSDKDVERFYIYQEKFPDIFWMVKQNSTRDPIERGWQGSDQYPFNCIDREDDWCYKNRHTKLLARSQYDLGLNPTAFTALGEVISDYGPYQEYDIDFKKNINEKDGRVYYSAHKADPQLPVIAQFVVQGPLTPEELAFEQYDIKEVCRGSNASFILKRLRMKIERIDRALKTNFILLLEKEAEKEVKESQKKVEGMPPVENVQQNQPIQNIQNSVGNVQTTNNVDHGVQKPVNQPTSQTQNSIQQPVSQPTSQIQNNIQQSIDQPINQVNTSDTVNQPLAPTSSVQNETPQKQDSNNLLNQAQNLNKNIEQGMLPCVKCGKPYPISELTCPYCGYTEVEV